MVDLSDPLTILGWALLALLVLALATPRLAARRFLRRRRRILRALEEESGATVLTLVHGKGPLSLFGWPIYTMIDMDDAEALLRAIRRVGPDRPLDVVVHTPGGQYHAALQIARALSHHKARVRVLVPHYAMSGGTLIALGADEIVMDPDAVMGAVDPQVGDLLRGWHSTTSWVKIAREKGKDADDATLALADVSEKLLAGTRQAVLDLVKDKVPQPETLVARLVQGGYAHAYPLSPAQMKDLGLPVRTDLSPRVHDLLALYRGPRRGMVEP
ncbi:MAG TPA: ATP-dependent Clp protease proteolytic subunit [Candidatus Thermoplasmatota archaeon]|nr:ATP-dependent Clp protease proteolytic subunit [Candidatus Thermoplasmatota archaeon]